MAFDNAFKVMTYNCNGLGNRVKVKCILSAILKSRADIVFLQETHQGSAQHDLFKCKRFSLQIQAPGTSKARGVAILISAALRPEILSVERDPAGRYIFSNVKINDALYTLASIYSPNDKQLDFLEDTLCRLSSFSQGSLILGGDLNVLADPSLDYLSHRKPSRPPRESATNSKRLKTLLFRYQLCDVWRYLYPQARDYTHHSQQYDSFSRIDYILVSTSLAQTLLDAEVGLRVWSDHAWVMGRMQLQNGQKTRPQWKLQPNLLYLEPFKTEMEKEIVDYFAFNSDCGVSPQLVWDALKAVVRGKSISLASAHYKKIQKYKEELLHSIASLEKQHKKSCDPKVLRALTEERQKLDHLEISRIQKNILFLRQKYWLRSPKSLKLLSWKVKAKHSNQAICAIKDRSGKRLVDAAEILTVFKDFYASLYSSTSPTLPRISDYLRSMFGGHQLTTEHAEALDLMITPDEVLDIINSLKNNKAPGDDGFGAEFYKAYAPLLAQPLADLFNTIQTTGAFPPSWNAAVIAVIPKKGREMLDPKSYRPISLLNQDYKIFTALLAKRLNSIIGNYIHPDQSGFIPARDITDNVYKTLNIIHYCSTYAKDPSLIL